MNKIKQLEFETTFIENSKDGQAINIPKEMEIKDDKVYVKKIGNSLQIIPFHSAWQNLIDSLDNFTDDFMDSRQQPNNQVRDTID